MELVNEYMSPNLHFISPMGRKPAGLGNEIFGLAKALLGMEVFGGKVITPDYSKSMHEYPKTILENFESRRINIALKNRIDLGTEIFDQLGNSKNLWDYKSILQEYARKEELKNSYNLRIQHSSKMYGGFLAIREAREYLLKLFDIDLFESDPMNKSVSLHLRVPDVSDANAQRNLQKQVDEYFKPALRDLSRSDGDFRKLNLLTNVSSSNLLIADLIKFAKSLGFQCNYDDADSLTHLKILSKSSFIIPSVSTFSLLGIFLSRAKYFWPPSYTSYTDGWYSIWGDEKAQILGPTHWFRELNKSSNYNALKSRGMVHGAFNPNFLKDWLNISSDTGLSQDLIYYGSTHFGKEIYKN